jgi:hypothetical protein
MEAGRETDPGLGPLEELLSPGDEGWQDVRSWIEQSTTTVEVLPPDPARRPECLLALQVTTRSVLGALAWHTSGVLVDHRWLRLLGGLSSSGLCDLATASGVRPGAAARPPHVVVAHDVLGGRFAVNGGGLPCAAGEVAYFAPDTLRWEGLGLGNSDFVRWALVGDTAAFYRDLRWPGWEKEAREVPLDSGLAVYPPLFTAEATRDPAATSRRAVPWPEILGVQRDAGEQLSHVPEGATFRIAPEDEPTARRWWQRP